MHQARVTFKLAGLAPSMPPSSLNNLSATGLGVRLAAPVIVYAGQRISEGVLHLPEIGTVSFEGFVRWHKGRDVGIEFTRLSEGCRRMIMKFVSQHEREAIPVS
ncbi:MAG: PilZ domain-containing protein [Acidobacteria bacterium]|nr:PilZ domain-containing protein [Acidobacteriota bacterium]MBI3655703.1 PilZ domain-containing protein [Acidobacteriota bacterium]